METRKPNNIRKAKKGGYSAYKCDQCSKQFNDKYGLAKHRATHSDERPYECTQCDYAGKTSQYLRKHVRNFCLFVEVAHGDRKFECDVCGKAFHFGCKLKSHMRIHTGEKPYKCGECDKAFNSSYSLNTHKLIHSNSKPFQCSFCPYACRDSSTLRKHHARHGGLVTYYQCNMCDASCKSKARLKVHVAEKHFDVDTRKMECDACGKRFRFRNQLVNHIQAVHEKSKRGKCEVCGLVISNRGNLRYHMRIHVEHRPYVCTAQGCGKRYKHSSSLLKHAITHSPARQFPCGVCGRLFSREIRMRAHLKTHVAKVKNVQCDYCGVSFYNKTYLSTHMERKHGRRRRQYVCDRRGLVTADRPSIVMHIKYGHGEGHDVATCAVCEKTFKRHVDLKLHYWEEHEVEYDVPARTRKSKKPPAVEVKEEPCENLYDGEEFFQVSPKPEPVDDEAIEEATNVTTDPEHRNEVDIPAEIIDEFITPVLKGADKDRRTKHSKVIDKKSEEQVVKEVNSLMEKTRRKIAGRSLESKRRKCNRPVQKDVKVTNGKGRTKIMHRKNNKQKSNSLLVENFSINQTIDSKDRIVDQETVDDIEEKESEHVEGQEIDDLEETVTENAQERGEDDVEEDEIDSEDNGEVDTDIEDGDKANANEKTETKLGQNKKLKINTHQCYVCFKLYQTKEELLEHCKDHFDLCNIKTLKKCPLCDYVTNLSVTTHLKRKHKINVKVPYGTFADDKNNTGSRYYYKVNDEKIKKVEIIPSIKNLNKRESNKIDKRNREKKNKEVVKRKLVKKGKEWIVMNEKMKINDYLVPKFDKLESKKVEKGYLDRLKELYKVAKKEGKKMLFPCESCDKVCQTMSALKLHGRKHEDNPKPFKPKIWKHKNNTPNNDNTISDPKKKVTISIENRTALPKPVVNKHKCDKKLIDFYERNIKGSDVEFWQFLKIYNKMGRENVNDFEDLQKSNSFGLHCNEPEPNTPDRDLRVENNDVDNIRNATVKKANKVKKIARNAFTRVIRLSKRELKRRNEAKRSLREKIKLNSANSA